MSLLTSYLGLPGRQSLKTGVFACIVDGVQQSVTLSDSVRGSNVAVAELTIAFTGTTFNMELYPDRTTRNGVTNGTALYTAQVHVTLLVFWSLVNISFFVSRIT